ncbi:MAG: enoyl-CoA hydratase/isomerase family protein [Candidatus Dormibacteria bacterium]
MPIIEVEQQAGTAVVRMTNGKNAVDDDFLTSFEQALDTVEASDWAQILVTTGTEKHYCNGWDLDFLLGLAPEGRAAIRTRSRRLLARLLTFPLPTAAAINGHAFGLGAFLALAQDHRVMRADRGWFCLPEVDLGMRLHPFMIRLIHCRLPATTAHESVLAGRRYAAAAALEAGIVDAAASLDALMPAAVERCGAYVGKDREMLAGLKQDLYAEVLAAV